MIDQLHVQNVALIQDASLEFSDGLTVLTGETGAGKTALLGALKLLIGERADSSFIREGTEELLVEGQVFSPDDPDGHVVRRRLSRLGRGRIDIDGQMASVRELASGIGSTVDLCGQHEHQRLLSPSAHLELLDGWAAQEIAPAKEKFCEALAAARAAAQELERVQTAVQESTSRLDEAQFVLARIDEVDPQAGELDQLQTTLDLAEHAESLFTSVEAAYEALSDDDAALDQFAQALTNLEAAARYDASLATKIDTLRSSLLDVEDVAHELRDYRSSMEFDPAQLNAMQTRMSRLQGLMRSYGPQMEQVFERRAWAAGIVEASGDTGQALLEAQAAVDAAAKTLALAADDLEAARLAAAPLLAQRITEQMHRLEMGTAQLDIEVVRLARNQWTNAGPHRVELMYRAAAGMSARPLRRIASGGEISRVMLACKVVLGEADAVETLVFDEVDAGVGGMTAKALASVLSDLARTHQVVVVTHLTQIAVVADRQYVVRKTEGDTPQAVPQTHIDEVVGQDRVVEIARLLSGDASTASCEHARTLLDEASRVR